MRLPAGVEVLGPVVVEVGGSAGAAGGPAGVGPGSGDAPGVPGDGKAHRALIRVPRHLGSGLAAAVREAQRLRGARGVEDPVRVRVDPARIG
jgi:primosomal protein N' (replication factor Y)